MAGKTVAWLLRCFNCWPLQNKYLRLGQLRWKKFSVWWGVVGWCIKLKMNDRRQILPWLHALISHLCLSWTELPKGPLNTEKNGHKLFDLLLIDTQHFYLCSLLYLFSYFKEITKDSFETLKHMNRKYLGLKCHDFYWIPQELKPQ